MDKIGKFLYLILESAEDLFAEENKDMIIFFHPNYVQ